MNQPWVFMCPYILKPLSTLSPSHPSGLSQCIGFECPVSCIELGLGISFTYGNIHVSMLFSQSIPLLLSHTESKSLFFISVSLLLPCIQDCHSVTQSCPTLCDAMNQSTPGLPVHHQLPDCHYCLSKFHIYALIYFIGVSLSDLLNSV